MNVGTVIKAHLFRERLDVLIASLAPLIIMLESGYANAWTFSGGHLGFDFNTLIALFRGIFLEGLIYAMFKLVKLFTSRKRVGFWFLALIPGIIGVIGMVVSAGCNLGWVNQSGEMTHVVSSVAAYMPPFLVVIFKLGLGLLFPIAVGAFALFDITHLVEEMLASTHLLDKAEIVIKAETHRKKARKSAKSAAKNVEDQYDRLAEIEAQGFVDAFRKGDHSFGMSALNAPQPVAPQPFQRVNAVSSQQQPSLSAYSAYPALQQPQQQPFVNGQVFPAPFPQTGNTQNIQLPPSQQQIGLQKSKTVFGSLQK